MTEESSGWFKRNRFLALTVLGYIAILIVALLVFCPIKSTVHLLIKIPRDFHHVQSAQIIVYIVHLTYRNNLLCDVTRIVSEESLTIPLIANAWISCKLYHAGENILIEFLNYGGISETLEPLTLWQEYFEVGFP